MVRSRMAVVVLIGAAVGLAGCSSSSKSSSSSSSSGATTTAAAAAAGGSASGFCGRLLTTTGQLASLAPSAGADPSSYKTTIDKMADGFDGLRADAPAEVKPALDDMVTVLRSAGSALANPSGANTDSLQKMATQLPADSRTLTTYIASHCTGAKP